MKELIEKYNNKLKILLAITPEDRTEAEYKLTNMLIEVTKNLKQLQDKQQLSKVTDEEIHDAAMEWYEAGHLKSDFPHEPYSFIEGAKWLQSKQGK